MGGPSGFPAAAVMGMVRIQVRLTEAEHDRLRQIARRRRRSMADCIREAIRLFLERWDARADDLAGIAGKFRPVCTKDLKPHDRWFAEAAMGDRQVEKTIERPRADRNRKG